MATIIPFNDQWLYLPAHAGDDVPDSAFAPVTLPHTNAILPHRNVDDRDYQFVSTYRAYVTLDAARRGRHVYIDFDGAMIAATVRINGHVLGEHRGGYTPFSFELTEHLRWDEPNLITVHVDSTERADIPPYGHVVDYLTFGGIYRDVRLRLVDPCHVTRVFVKPRSILSGHPAAGVDVHVRNQHPSPRSLTLQATLRDSAGSVVASRRAEVMAPAQADLAVPIAFDDLPSVSLWSLDAPALYGMEIAVLDGGAELDRHAVRFGFREATFRPDGGFYLNGERLKLIGLNRHQTYPYIGAAAPARLQRRDAEILKHELALHIVRTAHYPQSPHFLDRCDEIGLLVFEEIPGWQHIGDEAWQALSLRDVRAMIERDWNHPSIILWGVRINESPDCEPFYRATNDLAHALDPTRQTGGVRYVLDSQFLEDVYTFNDFSDAVREPVHLPHLITEFSGHMFPTKRWDHDARLVEHALRHARIQDAQLGMGRVAGALGWCAFDYNTHGEFGAGDRVCYHGVMDIFRLPKYAAAFYASQAPPARKVVLRAATHWAPGDNDAESIEPLVIFSNCQAIDVYVGAAFLGRFAPDRATFPHLAHPPYQIRGLGLPKDTALADLRLVGYLAGEPVAEQRLAADGLPRALTLTADDPELRADGADMTRVVFSIVDRLGNRVPYTNQVVSFSLEGPAELIGENPFALIDGQAAVYVRAGHEPGTVRLHAATPRLAPASIAISVR